MKKLLFAFTIFTLLSVSLSAQKLRDKINMREQFGGKESNLQEKTITNFTLTNSDIEKATPGSSIGIGMTATLNDGTEMKTKGFADGKVKWGNYIVQVTGGTFNDGSILVNKDPRKIPEYKVSVKVAFYADSTQFKTLEFKVGFKANYTANYNGENGQDGKIGSVGKTGYTGTSDTGAGAHAGKGGDGEDGGDGTDGTDGQPGESVDVFMTAFKSETGETLLKVYVKSKTKQHEDFFIIDPNGGSLTINLKGGNGGSGGLGQQAGGGGMGGNSNTTDGYGGDGGDGGNGGNGGDGGNGANGGSATIYVDPSAKTYTTLIKFDNIGGSAGRMGTGHSGVLMGGGSGGSGKYTGKTGKTGGYGKNGQPGRSSGSKGPDVLILQQASGIDWNKLDFANLNTSSGTIPENKISAKTESPTTTTSTTSKTETPNKTESATSKTVITTVAPTSAASVKPLDKTKPGYFEEKSEDKKYMYRNGYQKSEGVYHGEVREYDNNQLYKIIIYTDGIEDGLYIIFDDGEVSWTGNYKNGKKDGAWKHYKNGVLEETEKYVNGVKQE